jgi:hypothetical protein
MLLSLVCSAGNQRRYYAPDDMNLQADANERLPLARQTFRSLLHDLVPLLPLTASCQFEIVGSV